MKVGLGRWPETSETARYAGTSRKGQACVEERMTVEIGARNAQISAHSLWRIIQLDVHRLSLLRPAVGQQNGSGTFQSRPVPVYAFDLEPRYVGSNCERAASRVSLEEEWSDVDDSNQGSDSSALL